MKMQRGLAWIVVVLAGLRAGACSAAPVFQYVFGQDTYTLTTRGTVNVPVYLQETVAAGDTPVLAPSGVGLLTAGVQVLFSDLPQPIQPARIMAVSDIMADQAFDFPTPSLTTVGARLSLGALLNPAVHGQEHSPGVYWVLLGTFRFTAGAIGGESTPIRATDYDPGFDDVVTVGMQVLDNRPIHDGTATITTTPEPGTMMMLAAAVLAGVVLWQGRRKLSRG
jgi:hypothetical protein